MNWSRISSGGAPANADDPGRGIVLDANILIRAVLGKRVCALLEAYEDAIAFYTPDVCFDDPREYLPRLSNSRGDDPETGWAVLDQIGLLVKPVDQALYRDFEQLARERMAARSEERVGKEWRSRWSPYH